MIEIEDLEDKMISVEDAVDNNNQETTGSPTNDLTFYYSVLIDKVSTSPNHPVESNKLLVFFKSVIQDSNFDLLTPFQLVDLPTKHSVGKNLIKL